MKFLIIIFQIFASHAVKTNKGKSIICETSTSGRNVENTDFIANNQTIRKSSPVSSADEYPQFSSEEWSKLMMKLDSESDLSQELGANDTFELRQAILRLDTKEGWAQKDFEDQSLQERWDMTRILFHGLFATKAKVKLAKSILGENIVDDVAKFRISLEQIMEKLSTFNEEMQELAKRVSRLLKIHSQKFFPMIQYAISKDVRKRQKFVQFWEQNGRRGLEVIIRKFGLHREFPPENIPHFKNYYYDNGEVNIMYDKAEKIIERMMRLNKSREGPHAQPETLETTNENIPIIHSKETSFTGASTMNSEVTKNSSDKFDNSKNSNITRSPDENFRSLKRERSSKLPSSKHKQITPRSTLPISENNENFPQEEIRSSEKLLGNQEIGSRKRSTSSEQIESSKKAPRKVKHRNIIRIRSEKESRLAKSSEESESR